MVIDLTYTCLQSTDVVVPEERVVQDDLVGTLSQATTPDLVLPQVSVTSSVKLPSTPKDVDEDIPHDKGRRSAGDADSMDECDALLTVPAGCESEVSC